MGKHTHPIWKSANKNVSAGDAAISGIGVFAGSAHLNEAFMQTASKAWRKLAAEAKAKGFSRESCKVMFNKIDQDMDGELDPGEIRKVRPCREHMQGDSRDGNNSITTLR